MHGADTRASEPEPVGRDHDVALSDRGAFIFARCLCGWIGWARRSRWRAYLDGLDHLERA